MADKAYTHFEFDPIWKLCYDKIFRPERFELVKELSELDIDSDNFERMEVKQKMMERFENLHTFPENSKEIFKNELKNESMADVLENAYFVQQYNLVTKVAILKLCLPPTVIMFTTRLIYPALFKRRMKPFFGLISFGCGALSIYILYVNKVYMEPMRQNLLLKYSKELKVYDPNIKLPQKKLADPKED
ncbi:unnamed protein product [Moneuplotes crassus]|uniref:Transmembrane protein n=1 Tax=Euplotes crassus TaxID=5936 RepID=A0AAD1XZA9_EUPCR|nr:unnamed protein product [Moneuplotes crassus]